MTTKPPTSRRWLQFRLGSLLLAMTLIAAWLGYYFSTAKRGERAAQAMKEAGAHVGYDYQRLPGSTGYSQRVKPPGPAPIRQIVGEGFFQNAESIALSHQPLTPEQLAPLRHLPAVRKVYLRDCQIGDSHLSHFAMLTQMEGLALSDNEISDTGLIHLAGMTRLNTISLTKNSLRGPGLAHLAKLHGLKQLFLQDNPISDEGLAHLGQISSLEMLGLAGTEITDEGLVHLANLKSLTYLGLTRTAITKEAIRKLQASLPNCELEWFPRSSASKAQVNQPP